MALAYFSYCKHTYTVNMGTMPKFNPDAHTATTLNINNKTYSIPQLYKQAEQHKEYINLRTRKVTQGTRSKIKYTLEERQWQARSAIVEIQARYNLSELQARGMQWQARNIVAKLGIDT